MRPLLLALACLVLTLQAQAKVQAQNYPTQPIRLISPFAAGGANDVLARVLGTKLADRLPGSIVVENRLHRDRLSPIPQRRQSPAARHRRLAEA